MNLQSPDEVTRDLTQRVFNLVTILHAIEHQRVLDQDCRHQISEALRKNDLTWDNFKACGVLTVRDPILDL